MSVRILILGGGPGLTPTPWDGRYVSGEYRPAWGGFGELSTAADPAQARLWPSAQEALEWMRQTYPNGRGGYRTDGRPNRPLTYFTVEIEPTSQ